MARNFSTNQNRHIYVAKSYGDVSAASDAGTISLKEVKDKTGKGFYFVYKGMDTVLRSDFIDSKNLSYVKAIKAADLRVPFKSQLVSLDSKVNKGNPVSGQDYILRIVLTHWIGMSEEDKYFKEGAVHATADMTAKDFYDAMVKSLNLAFAREIGANKDENPYLKFESTANGILITEKAQPWTLGLEQQLPVLFDAQPTTIYTDGDDVIWGKVTPQTVTKDKVVVGTSGRGNGHDIADLEYFAMGERGDQYRMIGWPNVIPTKYMVEPDKEYNVLELHHAFTDEGVNSYRSEKEITIVSTDASVIDQLVTAINTATGLDIDKISE